jgi:hypothetical protein
MLPSEFMKLLKGNYDVVSMRSNPCISETNRIDLVLLACRIGHGPYLAAINRILMQQQVQP